MDVNSPIESIPRISPIYRKRLNKLGIKTLRDLFYHFPFRYDDFSNIKPIGDLKLDETATVQGKINQIKNIRTWKKRIYVTEAYIQDKTGIIRAVWFNQPYLINTLKQDDVISLAGKVSFDKNLYLSNPAYEKITSIRNAPYPPLTLRGGTPSLNIREGCPPATTGVACRAGGELKHTGRLVAIYPETTGLSSRWLRYIIRPLLPKFLSQIKDHLPIEVKRSQNLLDLGKAIEQIHFPKSQKHANEARRRLAFDELFLIQLHALRQKAKWQSQSAPKINFDQPLIKKFVDSLPFKLTDAQRKAAWEILNDLEKPKPMNRLLEGDVGSGKTVVAAIGALQTVNAGYQVAFMAPTEILAQQHFKTITELLKDQENIKIGLLTGSQSVIARSDSTSDEAIPPENNKDYLKKRLPRSSALQGDVARNDMRSKISSAQIQILIGTHALIQENVTFKNLALVIVDEQHRFGVQQRAALLARTNTDSTPTKTENNGNLLYDELTYKIRGAIFEVKKQLGLGHKENIYQKALEEEFIKIGLPYEKEKSLEIRYNGKKIGNYRPDYIIDDKIILELKALPFIGKFEKQQAWHYLKGSEYELAILTNFGREDVSIERIIHTSPQESVSSPHKSAFRESASSLRQSAFSPHLLSMTATPIPRTLALTIYGDLDISLLDEMPKGRQEIITKIVSPAQRQQAYEFIRQQVKAGRQIFVICPRIEISGLNNAPHPPLNLRGGEGELNFGTQKDSNKRNWDEVKAVKQEYEKLDKLVFPDLKILMLHGKLKPKEKEKIMRDFKAGEADILVSTSVVEVGIDIPNATIMMIEGAERFGLAQLHQFRGRVGRGEHQSYCLLFTTSGLDNARLRALVKCKNGFELAEKDLSFRGPGEFFGTAQSGLPDLSMASLTDVVLVKSARQEAQKLVQKDPELKSYPLLSQQLQKFQSSLHLE